MAVGEHYRPTGDGDRGVYRVVGTGEDVALLRVADDAGRRVHSGELRRVPAAVLASEFDRVTDPDAGVTPRRTVRNALSGLYWSVRRFL